MSKMYNESQCNVYSVVIIVLCFASLSTEMREETGYIIENMMTLFIDQSQFEYRVCLSINLKGIYTYIVLRRFTWFPVVAFEGASNFINSDLRASVERSRFSIYQITVK